MVGVAVGSGGSVELSSVAGSPAVQATMLNKPINPAAQSQKRIFVDLYIQLFTHFRCDLNDNCTCKWLIMKGF